MNSLERKIKVLVTSTGLSPFDSWYQSIKDKRARKAIGRKLIQLRVMDFDNFKPLSGGLYELRIFYGPGYRVYFGLDKNVAILIHGGSKNTQRRDLLRVTRLWRQYKDEN